MCYASYKLYDYVFRKRFREVRIRVIVIELSMLFMNLNPNVWTKTQLLY